MCLLDRLKKCAIKFKSLLDTKYKFIVGRKGHTIEFTLAFGSCHFHHLAGLHKLQDKQEVQRNRERVFKNILSGKITYDSLCNSISFSEVEERLDCLYALEQFMDDNSLVFKYDHKKPHFQL